MKFCLSLVGVFISIALTQASDKEYNKPIIKPIVPKPQPPQIVCYLKDRLLPFCPPCGVRCPCIFPGTDIKIYANSADPAPYCPECPVITYIMDPCFFIETCTPEILQAMIDNNS